MAGKFAKETAVPVGQTRAEIENALARYGADAFGFVSGDGKAVVRFRLDSRHYQFTIELPDPADHQTTGTGRQRSPAVRQMAVEQATRSIWRALLLIIRAKLEAVASGIVTFEDEFLAQTVTDSGQTVAEVIRPQLLEHYKTRRPLMLGAA